MWRGGWLLNSKNQFSLILIIKKFQITILNWKLLKDFELKLSIKLCDIYICLYFVLVLLIANSNNNLHKTQINFLMPQLPINVL